MRRFKQTLAAVLCVCTLLTTDGQMVEASDLAVTEDTAAYTEEIGNDTETITDTETTRDTEVMQKSSIAEAAKNAVEATSDVKAAAVQSDMTVMPESETEMPSTEQEAEAEYQLTYLVMESSEVSTPDTQYVLAGINNEKKEIEKATLVYRNITTDTEYMQEADMIDGEALLFYLKYPDRSYSGEYELTAVICETRDATQTIKIAATGIDATYGVNKSVATTEDAQIITTEQAQQLDNTEGVVVSDATGAAISTDQMMMAVEQAKAATGSDGSVAATGSATGELIIVLDPGHGGGDSGACYYGLQEKNLNLAIAQACKAELEQYAGVKVYMTRNGDARPGVDSQDSLTQRVNIAKRYKADILVSIHNDVAVGSSASGAKVFYPNVSYNSAINQTGSGAAKQILQKLVSLGLKNDGIQIRNSACGDTYPDGSLADYYGLIRRGKYAGIPTLIIEHAFMTSYSDVANHLSTPAQLTALGVADATGIAKYYNLFKGSAAVKLKSAAPDTSTSVKLTWGRNKKLDGYKIYRATSKNGKYKLVKTIKGNKTTTYTNKKLKAGKTYYYKVSGYRGTRTYSASNKMKVYTLKASKLKSATAASSNEIELRWSKVGKASGYQIFRSIEKNGTYTKIKTIKNNKTLTYIDGKVNCGQHYYYKIRTYNTQNKKKGYGTFSNKCSGITIAAPQNVTAVQQTNLSIQVSWSKVDAAHGYEVYRAENSGDYTKVASVGSGIYNYTDTSAVAGVNYSYKVRTVNYRNKHYGYSSDSNIAQCMCQTVTEDTEDENTASGEEQLTNQ